MQLLSEPRLPDTVYVSHKYWYEKDQGLLNTCWFANSKQNPVFSASSRVHSSVLQSALKIILKQKRFKDVWEKSLRVHKHNAGLLPFHVFVCFQGFTAIRNSLPPWGFCWLLAHWHFPYAAGADSDKWEQWLSAAGYLLPLFSCFLRNRVWSMKIKQEEMILQLIFEALCLYFHYIVNIAFFFFF